MSPSALAVHATASRRRAPAAPTFAGRRFSALACTVALLLLAAVAPTTAATAVPTVRIGVLAPEGAEHAEQDWEPVRAFLEARLPSARLVVRGFDLAGLERAVDSGSLDFVITNPGHYVELELAHGVHRIATLQRDGRDPTAAIASAVIVRADRPELRTLADLAGRDVAAVRPDAFGGYLAARHALGRAGVEPERDFRRLAFLGFPLQNIVLAVADGRVDAGIVGACVLENMVRRGEIAAGRLRVLAAEGDHALPCARSTPLYPDWPFAALRTTPPPLSKQLAIELLSMPPTAAGLQWTIPTDYQSVHQVFRELGVGPYAGLGQQGLEAFLLRYRWWIAAIFLAAALWAWHTVRVEQLVHRRTRELQDALAAREAAERRAAAARETLDHLARLGTLGELSSMLAHELNQPLSAIGNYARGIEHRIEAGRLDPEALLAASQDIAHQADRAREVMRGIRGFAAKREGNRAPLRLADAIDNAVRLFRGMGARAPDIAVAADHRAMAMADRLQIELLVLNLLKNALDALAGQGAPPPRIDIACRVVGHDVSICVADNGAGLEPALRERLFEPFFTTKRDGLGLGLSICKRVAEAHGGRMWAEDGPAGRGLTVCFAVPALHAEPNHER